MHKEMMRLLNGLKVCSSPPYAPYKDLNPFFRNTAGLLGGLSGMSQYQVHDFLTIHYSFIQWLFFCSGAKAV
jgi:hypothetical protein